MLTVMSHLVVLLHLKNKYICLVEITWYWVVIMQIAKQLYYLVGHLTYIKFMKYNSCN